MVRRQEGARLQPPGWTDRQPMRELAVVVGAVVGASIMASALAPTLWLQPGGYNLRRPVQCGSFGGAKGAPREGAGLGGQPLSIALGVTSLGALVHFAGKRSTDRQRVASTNRTSRAALSHSAEDLEMPEEIHCTDLEELECTEVPDEVPFSLACGRRGALLSAAGATAGAGALSASAEIFQTQTASWEQYDLNTGQTLYDIDFDPQDPSHGFIVGARGLFYETKDYGKRWVARSFANLGKGENAKYRFQAVAVNGNDVWILGKPPLVLHSKDGGAKWSKVPLSKKLPGEPKLIISFGNGVAEMATNSGAVYKTENDGKVWKSRIRETVDATLNRVSSSGVEGATYFTGTVKSLRRSPDGSYLAVASRGNFFLTLSPKEDSWVPHNRLTSRRIQSMGYRVTTVPDSEINEGVWMTLNGGYLTTTNTDEYQNPLKATKDLFAFSEIRTGGIGIIDMAYRTPSEVWAVGGSGVIYYSFDGGKNFKYDKSGNELPCNLYNVKFFDQGKVGYMIGSAGILLRKEFPATAAGTVVA